jgi:hypothetical protein
MPIGYEGLSYALIPKRARSRKAKRRRTSDKGPRRIFVTSIVCFGAHAPGGLVDERGHRLRLRHIDRVTAGSLCDGRAGARRHLTLSRWRDHLVLGRNQVPARLAPPGWLANRVGQSRNGPLSVFPHRHTICRRPRWAGRETVD